MSKKAIGDAAPKAPAPAPKGAPAEAKLLPVSFPVAERIFRIIENPFVQTPISIVAGLVAVFYYGPVLILCSVSILAGVHRVQALNGLAPRGKIAAWIVIVVLTVTTFASIGILLDRHRDSIWTPQQLIGQVLKMSQTKSPPHIVLGEPEPFGTPIKGFQVPRENTGDEPALRVVNTGAIFVRSVNTASETAIFAFLYGEKDKWQHSPSDENLEPGFQNSDNVQLNFSPSQKELQELETEQNIGAYIALLVTYFDSHGRQYSVEKCMIYSPRFPELGVCNQHNK